MTAFVNLDRWVDTIMGRLNGAVAEMVRVEVTNAVREFFIESTVWQVEVLLDVEENTPTYNLTNIPAKSRVVFILHVLFKERLLTPVAEFPFGWNDGGDPHYYWSPEPGVLRLAPIPTVSEKEVIRTRLALQPTSCEVPDWIESHFFRVIVDGALGRLYNHAKRPYTSPLLGDKHSNSFRAGIARAKSMANRRFTRAEHSFRFPRGWSPVV